MENLEKKGLHSCSDLYALKETLQIPIANEGSVIGEIHYYGSDGNVGEVVEHTSNESYLNAIKKELDNNPTGFKHQTLTNDPEVRKSVDDLIYAAYGDKNPHSLEWYSSPHKHDIPDKEIDIDHKYTPEQIEKFLQRQNSPISTDQIQPTHYIKQLHEAGNFELANSIENGVTDFNNYQIFSNDKYSLSASFSLVNEYGNTIPKFETLTLSDNINGKTTDCMLMLKKLNENNVDVLKLNSQQFDKLFTSNSLNFPDIKGKELMTKPLADKPFSFSITRVGGKMFGFSSKLMSLFSKINEAVMG